MHAFSRLRHSPQQSLPLRLSLWVACLAGALLLGSPTLHAADQTVTGNLTVTANATVANDFDAGWSWVTLTGTEKPGNSGTWLHFNLDLSDITTVASATTYVIPGLNIGVTNGTIANVVNTGYNPNTSWTWQEGLTNVVGGVLYFNGTPATQMSLSNLGVLTVYNASNASNTLTLDPANQKIVFSSGVTLAGNATTLSIYSGTTGIALGTLATANGTGAVAMGNGSIASGTNATAMVGGTASAANAMAFGLSTTANATGAVALGNGSIASGANATAIGPVATANATGAIAIGDHTVASVYDSVVVGHYNDSSLTGSTSSWVGKDPAFVVGIGNSGTPANGLVILNNGDIYSGTSATYDSVSGAPYGTGNYFAWIPTTGTFVAATNIQSGSNVSYNGQVVLGDHVKSIGIGSVAIGAGAWSVNTGAVAEGYVVNAFALGSVALGELSDAHTQGSIAMGYNSGAIGGYGSVALGMNSLAWSDGDFASGNYSSSTGAGSVGIGNTSTSNGIGAIAMGNLTNATGNGTLALGNTVTATGNGTIVMGNVSTSTANGALALGNNITITTNATVNGTGSVALGNNLTVTTDHAFVAGQWAGVSNGSGNFTVGGSGPTSPLLVLGNGTSSGNLGTAFKVLKNGDATVYGNATIGTSTTNATLSGNVTLTKRQGDIIMGSFGNGGGD